MYVEHLIVKNSKLSECLEECLKNFKKKIGFKCCDEKGRIYICNEKQEGIYKTNKKIANEFYKAILMNDFIECRYMILENKQEKNINANKMECNNIYDALKTIIIYFEKIFETEINVEIQDYIEETMKVINTFYANEENKKISKVYYKGISKNKELVIDDECYDEFNIDKFDKEYILDTSIDMLSNYTYKKSEEFKEVQKKSLIQKLPEILQRSNRKNLRVKCTDLSGRRKNNLNIQVGDEVFIQKDINNKYDNNAIEIFSKNTGDSIGYIPAENAYELSNMLDKIKIVGEITSIKNYKISGDKIDRPVIYVMLYIMENRKQNIKNNEQTKKKINNSVKMIKENKSEKEEKINFETSKQLKTIEEKMYNEVNYNGELKNESKQISQSNMHIDIKSDDYATKDTNQKEFNKVINKEENNQLIKYFSDNKFNILKNIICINSWNRLDDINLEEIKKIKGIGNKKVKEIEDRIIEIKNSNQLYMSSIDEIYSDNKFEKFREIARKKNWKEINDIEIDELKEIKGLGAKRILQIISCAKDHGQEIKQEKDYSKQLKRIIIDMNIDSIYKDQLYNNSCVKELNCSYDELEHSIRTLIEQKFIYVDENIIYRIYEKLENAVDKYLKKEQHKDIFIKMLLKENTLAKVGEEYGLSRERIRQINAKAWRLIPKTLLEDKYKDIFLEYEWNRELFCKVFKENEIVYGYLESKYYKTGMKRKDIYEILDTEMLNKEQKEIIKSNIKYIYYNNNLIKESKIELILEILREEGKQISINELVKKYNEIIVKYNFTNLEKIENIRNIESIIARNNNVIASNKKRYRYYNYNKINQEQLQKLNEMMNLKNGAYYTTLFYENNKELMSEIEIEDEFELYNLLKKIINNKKIVFQGMPIILIGYENKEDFYIEKIKELSPIKVIDFVNLLNREYGHRIDSTLSYISATFYNYITNGILDIYDLKFTNEEFEIINNYKKKSIYSIDEMKRLLENLLGKDCSKYVKTINMEPLGYKIRGNYIINEAIYEIENNKENESIDDSDDDYNFIKCFEYLEKIYGYGIRKNFDESKSSEFLKRFDNVLATLTPLEKDIIIYRYGLKDGITHTAEETSNKIGIVASSTVSAMEKRIAIKLKDKNRTRILRSYLKFNSDENTDMSSYILNLMNDL